MNGPPPERAHAGSRLARAILRVPLFIKLVIAQTAVVIAVVVVGAWYVRGASGGTLDLMGDPRLAIMTLLAVLATIAVNAWIVRLALRPIRLLEETAGQVARGDLSARAPVSNVADRDFVRVIHTFNDVLEAGESNRKRLREVAARSAKATEEERLRISRELHDGVAQTLAAARVRLRLARAAKDPDLQARELDTLSADLGNAIEELRRIALGLRPPALDVLGLGAAVEGLVRSVAETGRLDADVRVDLDDRRLGDEAELALYRILQEALSNVVRHAGARRVQVRLHRRNGGAELMVKDDGHGFSMVGSMAGSGGLGLLGMQERAAYVGGELAIRSEPGAGTCVTAEIPFAGNDDGHDPHPAGG